jgi:hypothetical protein
VGEHTLNIQVDGESVNRQLVVNPFGGARPNSGRRLYIKADYKTSGSLLYNFFVSDQNANGPINTGSAGFDTDGTLLISEADPSSLFSSPLACLYNVSTGVYNSGSSFYTQSSSTTTQGNNCFKTSSGNGDPGNIFKADLEINGLQPKLDGPSTTPGHDLSAGSYSSVHDQGSYDVFSDNGELMLGYERTRDESFGGLKWHICRGGADGRSVALSRGAGSVAYRCDAQESSSVSWRDSVSNDWELVEKCQDGVDNDGDGNTDLADVGCEGDPGKNSESLSSSSVCEPKMAFNGTSSDPTFTFWYDADGSPPNCDFQNRGSVTKDSGYIIEREFSGIDRTKCYAGSEDIKEVSLNPDASKQTIDDTVSELDQFCSTVKYYGSSVDMPVTLIYPDVETLLEEGGRHLSKSNVQPGDMWSTDWLDAAGWDAYKQSLRDAETGYSSGDPQKIGTWEGKGVQTGGDYTTGDLDNRDSWEAAPIGGGPLRKVGSDNFPGGFVPKCSSSDKHWSSGVVTRSNGGVVPAANPENSLDNSEYGSRFRCRFNEIPTGQVTNLDVSIYSVPVDVTIHLNDQTTGLENHYAGFKVSQQQAQKWNKAFPGLLSGPSAGNWKDPKIRASCFVGKVQNGLPPSDEVINMSTTLQPNSENYVVGKLPPRSGNVNTQEFSCVWGFTQEYDSVGSPNIYGMTGSTYVSEGIGIGEADRIDRISSEDGNPIRPPAGTAGDVQDLLEKDFALETTVVGRPGSPAPVFNNFISRTESIFLREAPNHNEPLRYAAN